MSHRFNFARRHPVDLLLDKGCDLRRSLSDSTDFIEREQNIDVIESAETILFNDLTRMPGTIELNGESLAKVFRSLAYSQVGWCELDPIFKAAILHSIYKHHFTMSGKDVSNTLWALARMGCPNSAEHDEFYLNSIFTDCLLQTVSQKSGEFIFQTGANILWSFAMLDLSFSDFEFILPDILRRIIAEMDKDISLKDLRDEHVCQLKEFLEYYKNNFSLQQKQEMLRLLLCVNRRIKQMTPEKSSALHKDIERFLRRYCANIFKSEFPIAGGSADICFEDEKIILDVLGPSHYYKNGEVNAQTLFRKRLMEKQGFTVVHIHYWEWQNSSDKKQFILDLISRVGLRVKVSSPKKQTERGFSFSIFMPPHSDASIEMDTTQEAFKFIIKSKNPGLKRPREDDLEDKSSSSGDESAAKRARYEDDEKSKSSSLSH